MSRGRKTAIREPDHGMIAAMRRASSQHSLKSTMQIPAVAVSLLFAWLAMWLPALTIAQEAAAAAATGSIHGVVVSTVDGKPLSGATVVLGYSKQTTVTDSDGRFEFPEVKPGQEMVSAGKAGFMAEVKFDTSSALKYVDVEAGKPAEVSLALMPLASISGHVRNSDGAPIRGVHVSLLRRGIENGRFVLQGGWLALRGRGDAGNATTTTDLDGAFKFPEIPPGAYYLRTWSLVDPDSPRPDDSGTKRDVDYGYVTTYYPNSYIENGAEKITVAPGGHGVADFHLARQTCYMVTVNISAEAAKHQGWPAWITTDGSRLPYVVRWYPEDGVFRAFVPNGSYTLSLSVFSFNVERTDVPGHRVLEPQPWSDGNKETHMAEVEFTVKDGPLTLPEPGLHPEYPPVTIPVHLRLDFTADGPVTRDGQPNRVCNNQELTARASGKENGCVPFSTFLSLTGPDQAGLINDTQIAFSSTDAHYKLKDLKGRFNVYVHVSRPLYLAQLTCGDANLLTGDLVVRPGQAPCTIEGVLKDDAGSVEVSYSPEAVAAMNEILAQADPHKRRLPLVHLIPLQGSATWPRGGFINLPFHSEVFDGVPPGEYLAVVYGDHLSDAFREPETAKRLLTQGKVVTVKPNERSQGQVDWEFTTNNDLIAVIE
jgi:hypothetical protein